MNLSIKPFGSQGIKIDSQNQSNANNSQVNLFIIDRKHQYQ